MLMALLYFILILLILAITAVYLLHIPLPHDISDRSKLAVIEFILRIFNEHMGHVVENIFGAEIRNAWMRKVMGLAGLFKSTPPPGIQMTEENIAGVECITYNLENKKSDALFVFIHGGGWCVGNGNTYNDVLYEIVQKLSCCAVSINYRLAPEHRYPKGLDDCESVVRELHANGHSELKFNPKKIIVAGDSAGGNLTAALCLRLKRKNEQLVKAQVLIYPVTSMFHFDSPSYQEYFTKYAGTALLSPRPMARWMLLYLGVNSSLENIKKLTLKLVNSADFQSSIHYKNLPSEFLQDYKAPKQEKIDRELAETLEKLGTDPEVSPLFGDTEGLPPALVLTAGYDVLRDEGILYAKKLEKSGVPTVWKHNPRAFHGLLNLPNSVDASTMIREIIEFSRNYI